MGKHKFTTKMSNAVESSASTSVWGYRGCPGKGGKTHNASIAQTNIKNNEKEND